MPHGVMADLDEPILMFAACAAAKGVPGGILYYAEKLLADDETHSRNAEIIHQLHRPAVRQFPRTTQLLAALYESSYFELDLGKAASLIVSLPRSHEHVIVEGLVSCLRRKWVDRLDHVCRERLVYGRALALGTTRLPVIPRHMVDEGDYGKGMLFYLHDLEMGRKLCDTDCPALLIGLLYHELRDLPLKRIDGLLIKMVNEYWNWIEAVQNATIAMIGCLRLRRCFAAVPRDIAGLLGRLVWDNRLENAPLWCGIEDPHAGNKRRRVDQESE
jgi:hypothetical protein